MKSIKSIVDYLIDDDYRGPLIIAPGAPPVCRGRAGMEVATDVILTAQNVVDALVYLKGLEPIASRSTVQALMTQDIGVSPDWAAKAASLPEADSFSFGILEVGRFRVDFLTQRGSKIVSIARIPLEVPSLDSFCRNAEVANDVITRVMEAPGGVLAVWGPSIVSSGIFVYSLLRAINDAGRKVIYILERSLTFLMNHNNSIVIQSEINTDAGSFEAGLRSAYPFGPNIIFLGDLWPGEEIPSLQSAETKGAVAIVSSAAMTGDQLLAQYGIPAGAPGGDAAGALRASVRVEPVDTDTVSLSLDD